MYKTANGTNRLADVFNAADEKQEFSDYLQSIAEDGDRIVFQLHSDPENVLRSVSLGGARPHINQILDKLAGKIGRDLKYVYDYEGHRYKMSFADYVK